MRSLLAFAILIMASVSQAYIVITPAWQGSLDDSKRTHVIISGRGTDLGPQPQQAAMTAALLYHRNSPQDQVVIVTVYESAKVDPLAEADQAKNLAQRASNKSTIKASGYHTILDNNSFLDTASVLTETLKFQKIASFELFGHNSATLGTQTDGSGHRFNFFDAEVAKLASHFTSDAYAWVHGCNGGWAIAPQMSKLWGIPVAAAFTETRFEHLHSDGHYYVYDERKAPNTNWAKASEFGVSCQFGGCIRMHPAFSPYNGEWGNFAGPMLPHYKFFCQGDITDCEKRMALALYAYPSEKSLKPTSSIEDFKAVAKDYLCPVYSDRNQTNACNAALDAISNNGGDIHASFAVNAKQLKCNLKSCTNTEIKCSLSPKGCVITGRESDDASTLAQEYMHFIRGFQALHAGTK